MSEILKHILKHCSMNVDRHDVRQALTPHHAAALLDIPARSIVQTQFLSQESKPVAVVTSANQGVNLFRLTRFLKTLETPVYESNSPIWAAPLSLDAGRQYLVDSSLDALDFLYIPVNEPGVLLCLPQKDWLHLTHSLVRSSVAKTIYHDVHIKQAIDQRVKSLLSDSIKTGATRIVPAINTLPVLSDSIQALIRLKNSDDVAIEELESVIEKDPVVSAHLLKHARSPVFVSSNIKTLQQAIYLALGVPDAINIALAVQLAQSVKLPSNGPVSGSVIWLKSLATAIFMRRILQMIEHKASPEQVSYLYLAGLMRNIGLLAMCAADAKKYTSLNQQLACMPEHELPLERAWFGASRFQWARSLLTNWGLAPETVELASYEFQPGKFVRSRSHSILALAEFLSESLVLNTPWRELERPSTAVMLADAQLDELFRNVNDDLQVIPNPVNVRVA